MIILIKNLTHNSDDDDDGDGYDVNLTHPNLFGGIRCLSDLMP